MTSVLERGISFSKWDGHTLLAWLEVWVGVPFWYIAAIRNCLQSGKTLAVSVGGGQSIDARMCSLAVCMTGVVSVHLSNKDLQCVHYVWL